MVLPASYASSEVEQAWVAERGSTERWTSAVAYGAKFDGATDDSAAIQAAIDAVVADGGGTVRLPTGTAKIGTTLTLSSNVHLEGEGRESTVLETTGTTSVPGDYMIVGANVDNVSIKGMEIVGPGKGETSGYGIYFGDTGVMNRMVLEDLYVREFPDDGVYVLDAILSGVRDCWFRNCAGYGLHFYLGTTTTVESCYFSGCNTGGLFLDTVTSFVVNSSAAEYCPKGFHLDRARNCTFNSCYAERIGTNASGTIVAAVYSDAAEACVFNGFYSNSFAYTSGATSVWHMYFNASSEKIVLISPRFKTLVGSYGEPLDEPDGVVDVIAGATVMSLGYYSTDDSDSVGSNVGVDAKGLLGSLTDLTD